MGKGLFDLHYGADPAKVNEELKEIVREKVTSAFDTAIRSEREKIVTLKEEAQGLVSTISNGDIKGIKRLGEIDLTIADAQDLIAAVQKRKTEFFPA